MNWRIEQTGTGDMEQWRVYKVGGESHYACTAKDAVALKRALEQEDAR